MLRVLVIENVPPSNQESWWKKYVRQCNDVIIDTLNVWPPNEGILDFMYDKKNELLKLIRIAVLLYRQMKKNKYNIIITIQGGRETFLLSLYQTILRKKRPAHVVIDFIMREKQKTLKSKIKYSFMKFCLSSVTLVICSCSSEVDYYETVFNWRKGKAVFIPLYIRPMFLNVDIAEGEYIFSAGRTFRDYGTLLKAVAGLPEKVVIVAGRKNFENVTASIPENVKIIRDIPLVEYAKLLAKAKFVVLPLQERKISVGQQVLLESMALGKAVIATSVGGIVDYVVDGTAGLLVKPHDYMDLRRKISLLIEKPDLRASMGQAAKEKIKKNHQVQHYINTLCSVLKSHGFFNNA